MFSRIKNFLTTYNTNQISEITNRPIHCFIYRFIQLCITAYIILLIVEGKLYLKNGNYLEISQKKKKYFFGNYPFGPLANDPPIPGAVRLTLQEPNNFTKPSYCVESSPTTNPPSCAVDKLPCVYWGAKEIQYPIEETGVAFFTTRASIVKYPQGTCKILASSPEDACIINSRKSPGESVMNSSFIADIENYTVMIEHTIASIDGKILLKNRLMDGQFLSADDTTVIKSWWANSNEADGDILTMKEILDAAGADLRACSSAPGANKDVNESNRSSGIIINNVYNYKYKPRIIDDAEYKIIEATSNIDDGSYIIKNRHGIRLVFHQHGKIRSFSWTALIINITASLYSYRVVSLIMDFSIRHEVDTWFRGIFRSNRNNDIENNEDNEETLPLIRYEDENENEQI
ncbi:hypothetical protein RhiirC2_867906 [Rhizophagus irregularis]|uniref:Uncharacterized protein n=1 Tax=Rhizophagus irregularis TaxID=588596 RepID=A0A2N1MZZ4_9GLOM|nr:hypothetical protein RhiirC2_867906 [Rhizophagus irregularis]